MQTRSTEVGTQAPASKSLRMYLRIAATVLLILGLTLAGSSLFNIYNIDDNIYGFIRWIHVAVALSVLGLYEANMARNRKIMTPRGRQLGLIGRITISLALLFGIFLLLNEALNFLGDRDRDWIGGHVVLGLISVVLTEVVFARRRFLPTKTK